MIDTKVEEILEFGEIAINELETYLMGLNMGKEKFELNMESEGRFMHKDMLLMLKLREAAQRAMKSFLTQIDDEADIELPSLDIPFINQIIAEKNNYPNINLYIYSKLDEIYESTFSTCAKLKRMLEFFKNAKVLSQMGSIM